MGFVRPLLLLLALGLVAGSARAQYVEIWRCVDAKGKILFTNDRSETSGKRCKLISRERVDVSPQEPSRPAVSQVSEATAPSQARAPRVAPQPRAPAQPTSYPYDETPPAYYYSPPSGYVYNEPPSFFFVPRRGYGERREERREVEEHERSNEERYESPQRERREELRERRR